MQPKALKFAITVTLLIILSLTACKRAEYSDSHSCRELSDSVSGAWQDGKEYSEYGEKQLGYIFDSDTRPDDFCISYSTQTDDIDELGVFHASEGDTAERILDELSDYLNDMREDKRAFIASYAPNELQKLDGAKLARFGNYVVYVIASPERAEIALKEIEQRLK